MGRPRTNSKTVPGTATVPVRKIQNGGGVTGDDYVVVEEPLEIRVDNHPVSITMRTPGSDRELAAGFLLTEGVLKNATQIRHIAPHPRNPDNIINIFLRSDVSIKPTEFSRHTITSASCGICGYTSLEAMNKKFPLINYTGKINRSLLSKLPVLFQQHQATFACTGGLHAAAVFTTTGEILTLKEDVGRHNAVDKVIGELLLRNLLPLSSHILMVSGRISFEIVQKALAAGIPILAAVSAPSNLAIAFAKKNKQLLIGFLREGRMNVYTRRTLVS